MMVDDERHVSAMTRDFLRTLGYHVTLLHNAADALMELPQTPYALCVLDVQMPMKDGFALAGEIRETHPEMPIIFLTAKTTVEDRVKGLKLGADDYVTKPYSLEELRLRIENIIKRAKPGRQSRNQTYMIGQWEFDPMMHKLVSADESITLSTIESKLLAMLYRAPDGLLEKDVALQAIWQDEYRLKQSNLKVYISKLRKYFAGDASVEILNVHGVGYRLVIIAN